MTGEGRRRTFAVADRPLSLIIVESGAIAVLPFLPTGTL